MTKINKVDLSLGQKLINSFKTTRKSTTNPFENNPFNFEGNTLDVAMFSADVFEGTKTNKLKMITSSVIGSMTKLRNSITEPIAQFVNRVKDGITHAWDYAKNTNVSDIIGIKNLGIDKGLDKISGLGKTISDKINVLDIGILSKDITEIGKGLSDKWTALVSTIHHTDKISAKMPVAELQALWIKENELVEAGKKVA